MKKLVTLVLCSVILFSVPLTSYASESQHTVQALNRKEEKNNQKEKEEIINETEELTEQFGYEVVGLENVDTNNLIKIESVEELEQILNSINEESAKIEEMAVIDEENIGSRRALYYGAQTATKWAPLYLYGLGSVVSIWKNCSISYTYDQYYYDKKFKSIDNIDSYLNGIVIAQGWQQTGSYSNISYDSSSCDVGVVGYGYLGFDIKGVPVAIRINETWNFRFYI